MLLKHTIPLRWWAKIQAHFKIFKRPCGRSVHPQICTQSLQSLQSLRSEPPTCQSPARSGASTGTPTASFDIAWHARRMMSMLNFCGFPRIFDLIKAFNSSFLCFYVLNFDIFSLALICVTRNCCFPNQNYGQSLYMFPWTNLMSGFMFVNVPCLMLNHQWLPYPLVN